MALLSSGFADSSPDMLSARLALGNVALAYHDYDEASTQYSRCVSAASTAHPDGHPMEGFCRYGAGRAALSRGLTALAVEELERAYSMMKTHVDADGEARSEVALELVRALRLVDPDSARAAEISDELTSPPQEK